MSEPKDFVICRICGKKLKTLGRRHFMSKHCKERQIRRQIDVSSVFEYNNIFPGIPTRCTEHLRKCPWNKDLTKETDERVRKKAERQLGRQFSKQHRENLSKAHTGKKLTEEHKQNIAKGNTGRCVSKETRTKISNSLLGHPTDDWRKWWDSLTVEEREGHLNRSFHSKKAREKAIKTMRRMFNLLTKEEKMEWVRRSLLKGGMRPNKSEKKLISILDVFGFSFNNFKKVSRYFPDFVHSTYLLVVEYDGPGGHRPSVVSYLPSNKPELDDQRDQDYRDVGYEVLRILPEDLVKSREIVQEKVRTWMISLGYDPEWKSFDLNGWFM